MLLHFVLEGVKKKKFVFSLTFNTFSMDKKVGNRLQLS